MTTEHRQHELESRLHAALAQHDTAALAQLLDELHAADLADLFLELEEDEQIAVLEALRDEQAATLLDELEPNERADVLDLLPLERTSDILEEMPSDEAADLLGELSTEEADALLERMEPELADDVAELLRYSDDSAGGLMAKEFVRVAPEQTVAEVLAVLRRHHDDAEMIYYLYVIDEDDRLIGIVTLRRLIVSDPAVTMSQIMGREIHSVTVQTPQSEVADLVRRHDLLAVPVLDDEGRMQGIVTVDDVGDVVQEEAAEDLLEMSGSEPEGEMPSTGVPWPPRGLRTGLLALFGGLVSAVLIWRYAGALADWMDIALLVPLLLVLGITAANQAALAMDHAYESAVERHQVGRIFRREVLASLVLALIAGLLAEALLFALRARGQSALANAIPLTVSLWVASIGGALGAVTLRRRGDRLSPASHTIIVVLSLLIAVSVYLLMAGLVSNATR